jgi:hypothetical protein
MLAVTLVTAIAACTASVPEARESPSSHPSTATTDQVGIYHAVLEHAIGEVHSRSPWLLTRICREASEGNTKQGCSPMSEEMAAAMAQDFSRLRLTNSPESFERRLVRGVTTGTLFALGPVVPEGTRFVVGWSSPHYTGEEAYVSKVDGSWGVTGARSGWVA